MKLIFRGREGKKAHTESFLPEAGTPATESRQVQRKISVVSTNQEVARPGTDASAENNEASASGKVHHARGPPTDVLSLNANRPPERGLSAAACKRQPH